MKFTEKQMNRMAKIAMAILTSVSIIMSIKALRAIRDVIKDIFLAGLTIIARIIKNPKFEGDEDVYELLKVCREVEKEENIRILDDEQRQLVDEPQNKIKMGFC